MSHRRARSGVYCQVSELGVPGRCGYSADSFRNLAEVGVVWVEHFRYRACCGLERQGHVGKQHK